LNSRDDQTGDQDLRVLFAFGMNRRRALGCCSSMISEQTRSAFVARDNRSTYFRIML